MEPKLFTPIVDDLHPYVKNMIEEPDPYLQEVLLKWFEGFIDRDGKFIQEFQNSFNSSFWELYLFACLKELGLQCDFSKHSPDFIIKNTGKEFCIEARIANNASDAIKESDQIKKIQLLLDANRDIDVESIFKAAMARLNRAICNKYAKLCKSYLLLEHVRNKPFVLAIAPFEQPFFQLQATESIIRVLYDSTLTLNGYMRVKDTIPSTNLEFSTGYFTNNSMPEISAVIFSNVATIGKVRALSRDPNPIIFRAWRYGSTIQQPIVEIARKEHYHETLLDGLHVFHNPFANHPLDKSIFDYPLVTQHTFDILKGGLMNDFKEGAIIVRNVQRIRGR